MPKVREMVAERRAQESTLRRNPEIDARLDAFIGNRPELFEYYNGYSKEELIRKFMLEKMQQKEGTALRNDEIRAWVEKNPVVKARIEEKIRNVPEANRTQAFMNVARKEVMNHTLRPNGVSMS